MVESWRELHDYWRSKHVAGRPPTRDQLDPPVEIPQLARNLLLIDVTPRGLEYRLVGTNFVDGAGVDMTGMMVGDSGKHAHVIDLWRAAIDAAHQSGRPKRLIGRFAPYITAGVTILLLPLAPVADGVPKILGGLFVQGQFPPSTQIEAFEVLDIGD